MFGKKVLRWTKKKYYFNNQTKIKTRDRSMYDRLYNSVKHSTVRFEICKESI